jgi:hypothetical protein
MIWGHERGDEGHPVGHLTEKLIVEDHLSVSDSLTYLINLRFSLDKQ